MAKRSWQHVDSEVVYKDDYFSVRRDNVIRPDGTPGSYAVVQNNGAVFVVAVTKDQKILLLEQERYPVGRDVIELPAGGLQPGQDPIEQAGHELHEEANATAKSFEKLGTLISSPSRQNIELHVVLAAEVEIDELSTHNQEGNEAIHRVWAASQTEILGMIRDGVLEDSATLAALNLYWAKYGFPHS